MGHKPKKFNGFTPWTHSTKDNKGPLPKYNGNSNKGRKR